MIGRILVLTVALLFAAHIEAASVERLIRSSRPSRGDTNYRPLSMIDGADWIRGEGEVVRYRVEFDVSEQGVFELDVSADQNFALILDGKRIARGPHRGSVDHWLYQSYRLNLDLGRHLLEAVVTTFGTNAPIATLSNGGGFILAASGKYDEILTTGKGNWKAGRIEGTMPTGTCKEEDLFGAGSEYRVDGTDFLHALPKEWMTPKVVRERIKDPKYLWGVSRMGWALYPSPLPDMFEAEVKAKELPNPQVFPANSRKEIIFDLGNYFCFYPEAEFSGGKGAKVSLKWVESLRKTAEDSYLGSDKGNRNEREGKVFWGAFGDEFVSDGRQNAHFTTPWWRPGRWGRLIVETASEPLELKSFKLVETHYPINAVGSFKCDDESLEAIARICRRGIEECGHDITMDCPRYEQQMYPGDAQMYFTGMRALTSDDRLLKRCVDAFDFARRQDGSVPMNWPTKNCQNSPTWTLCWVQMVGDQMRWHDDRQWLKAKLPGVRHTMSGMEIYTNADGLLENAPGWAFLDWVPSWGYDKTMTGTPPNAGTGSGEGCSMVLNGLYLLTLETAAELEDTIGDRRVGDMWRDKAAQVRRAMRKRFFVPERGLFADTEQKDIFSVHSQVFALLGSVFEPSERSAAIEAVLNDDNSLTQCAPYFLHYVFKVAFEANRTDYFFKKLSIWKKYVQDGLKCPLESPTFPRSDCHGFAAFPIYHYQTGLAGVSPAAPFFSKVRVSPQPGKLKYIEAATPHPKGTILTKLHFGEDGAVNGVITTPVPGIFEMGGKKCSLMVGENRIF